MSSIKHIFPLTPLQEGIYFHHLDKNSNAYFEQVEYQVKGALDISILEASLIKLFERHDILRTNFVHKPDHRILQVVSESKPIDFNFFDLEEEENKLSKISLFKEQDISKGFDLKMDILFRVSVFKLEPSDYRVICSNHHILLDGWSRGFILTDLFEIYQAIQVNDFSKLRRPKSFRDYVVSVAEKNSDAASDYWKTYLKNFDNGTRITDTIGRGRSNEYEDGKKILTLNSSREIKQFCAKEKFTVNSFLNSVWAIAISTLTGSKDLVFGIVLSGRSADLQSADEYVGLLINTLPLRVKINSEDTIVSVLSRVQSDFLGHERHQHYPLKSIISLSKFRQNLIDHILVFENYPKFEVAGSTTSDLNITSMKSFQRSSYDLNVVFTDTEQIDVLFSFNKKVFSEETVDNVFDLLESTISQILESPLRLLSQLTISSLGKHIVVRDLENSVNAEILYEQDHQLSEIEQLLIDTWKKELKLPTISVFDNLFELGADSIMAIQVAMMIKRLGYKYAPTSIYDNPTIFELAKIVTEVPSLKVHE